MITRTIGATGQHTDVAAWVSYVQANYVVAGVLTDDQTGAIIAAGLSVSTAQVISGWGPSVLGYTTTLTYDPASSGAAWFGQNCRANALIYNTARGAFITSSYSAGGPAGAITWRVNKNRTIGLMIKATGGYTAALRYDTTSQDDLLIEGNFLWATSDTTGVIFMDTVVDGGANIIGRNNVSQSDRGAGGSSGIHCDGCTTFANRLRLYDNAFHGQVTPVAMGSNTYLETIGNVMVTAGICAVACRDAQCNGSNNATNKAAFNNTGYGAGTITGLTSTQFSITLANEFVGVTTGTPTDFRLKSGGTALQGTNIVISGVNADITGVTRGSPTDIGPYQFAAGGNVYNVGVTETASGADSPSSQGNLVANDNETGTAVETITGQGIFPRTVAETASPADTVTNGATYSDSVAEVASPADTLNAQMVRPATVTESAPISEQVQNQGVFPRAVSESGSGVDTESSQGNLVAARVETAAPVETITTQGVFPRSVTEGATAAEQISGQATLPSGIVETAPISDTDTASGPGQSDIVESAPISDQYSAQMIRPAGITDSAPITDSYLASVTLSVILAEIATAANTQAANLLAMAAVLETAPAADQALTQLIAQIAIQEAADAQDAYAQTGTILVASPCNLLAGAPRTLMLAGEPRVRLLQGGCCP